MSVLDTQNDSEGTKQNKKERKKCDVQVTDRDIHRFASPKKNNVFPVFIINPNDRFYALVKIPTEAGDKIAKINATNVRTRNILLVHQNNTKSSTGSLVNFQWI